jgi:hypothetical protein
MSLSELFSKVIKEANFGALNEFEDIVRKHFYTVVPNALGDDVESYELSDKIFNKYCQYILNTIIMTDDFWKISKYKLNREPTQQAYSLSDFHNIGNLRKINFRSKYVYKGLKIRLELDFMGFWRFYIAVPRRHVLFGTHYTNFSNGATYSNFSKANDNDNQNLNHTEYLNWWEFGWDYSNYYTFSIGNLDRCIRHSNFTGILNMDILTGTTLANDIWQMFDVILDIHHRKTGCIFSEIRPLGSMRNKRYRKQRQQRSILALESISKESIF